MGGVTATAEQVTFADEPEHHRYEARLGDRVVGFATYRLQPGRITFLHTEVDASLEGGGVGSRLARFVLDDARSRGLQVRPLCPFIAAYIRRHPEYQDLVVPPPAAAAEAS
jgi:predicted GNAT family acetyltransferase